MGGEFGDEDERLITRLENTQYDAAAAQPPPPNNGGGVLGDPENPGEDFGWNPDRASAGPGGPPDEKKALLRTHNVNRKSLKAAESKSSGSTNDGGQIS